MISLAVIVGHVLGERVPKRCRPDEDHPIQALFLYGTDKALRERVQIRRLKRQSNDADALPDEYVTKFVGVFRISIKDQIPFTAKEAIAHVGYIACDLRHP